MCQVLEIFISTFILLQSLSKGCQLQWSIEAEHGITDGTIIQRDGTSNRLTVSLREGQYIIWRFATNSSLTLQVFNIEYTNDGPSDTITVYINGLLVGSFNTRSQSNNGHLWNEPISSGPVGNITLSSGDRTVKLTATKVDDHGIEIDRIILGLLCTNGISNSEGLCPNSQEPDINNSWDRGHIIGVSVGAITISIGIISAVVGVITLITGIYYHRKRAVDLQSVVLINNGANDRGNNDVHDDV